MIILSALACWGTDYLDLVKNTQNSKGVPTARIPELIEKDLGFKIVDTKWTERNEKGSILISLRIRAEKQEEMDSVLVSYQWDPEWTFRIKKGTAKVEPVNDRAREWLKGKSR